MDLKHHIVEAVANIFASKLRSMLTLLGVLIGTASVVALVSSGQLATEHALAQFKTLGTDLLAVSISPAGQPGPNQPKLDMTSMPQIENSSSAILETAPYTTYFAPLFYNDTEIQGGILGATRALQNVVKIELNQGRFVTVFDKNAFYCVIGHGIAQKIRDTGTLNPIGKQIRVGDNIYTIVGIAQPWPENIFMYADIDNSLIVPIENSFLLGKYVQIQNIIFKLRPDADIDTVQQKITQAINNAIPQQQLFFRSAKQLIAGMQKQRDTLTLLLALIGGISLVVGGIGVMNIMLVSVVERRREIGIRMAVGATRRDIGLMFITEAIALTSLGGLLGILCGGVVAVSFVTAVLSHWDFHFYMMPPIIGFLVSALVGISFGFFPAYKASRLNPIDCLRSEV